MLRYTIVSCLGALIIALVGLSSGSAFADEKKEALARLKSEPTCPQVQKEALAYFSINKERINSFRRGASAKAAVPVLEVSGGYVDSKLDESTWDYIAYDTEQWLSKGAGGRAWDARGKLSWNLPQLVFNAEVLDVASLAGLVQSVLKEVTRLYYMRRRLQLDLILNPPADEATRLTKELRLEELTALLDAMTGGYFQRELTRRETIVSPATGPGSDAMFEQ
jgi:hypothetical protein